MTKLLHDFDHAELSTYLANYLPNFAGLDTITRFSGGQSNPTYKISSGKRSYVLRAKPIGKLLPSAHQVAREFQVMQALAQTDVPVPQMYHLSRQQPAWHPVLCDGTTRRKYPLGLGFTFIRR